MWSIPKQIKYSNMIGNYLGVGLNVVAMENNFKIIWIEEFKTHIGRSQQYLLMGWVQRIRKTQGILNHL